MGWYSVAVNVTEGEGLARVQGASMNSQQLPGSWNLYEGCTATACCGSWAAACLKKLVLPRPGLKVHTGQGCMEVAQHKIKSLLDGHRLVFGML
jgi:hypothetical protein